MKRLLRDTQRSSDRAVDPRIRRLHIRQVANAFHVRLSGENPEIADKDVFDDHGIAPGHRNSICKDRP